MISTLIAAITTSGSVAGPGGPPTEPAAFADGQWSLLAGDTELAVIIGSLPSSGGSPILDIEYRVDGGSWTSSGGTSSFVIGSLTNGIEYDIEIRAVNAIGNGAASSVKAETPVSSGGETFYLLTEDGDRITREDGTPVELPDITSGLMTITAPDGTEYVFFVQGGATVKCTLDVFMEYING